MVAIGRTLLCAVATHDDFLEAQVAHLPIIHMAVVPFLVLTLLTLARRDVFSSTGHMAELVVKSESIA